jgi:hypothetical protein
MVVNGNQRLIEREIECSTKGIAYYRVVDERAEPKGSGGKDVMKSL